jgi:hypothetical protein
MARAIEDRDERRVVVEQRRDRLELAREAGFGGVSAIAVIAGVMTALGVCAVGLAIAAALVNSIGIDTESLSDGDWRNLGVIGAAATIVVLAAAFLAGGYTAGRMARRAGAVHGALVCGFGTAALGVAFGVAYLEDTTVAVVDHLDGLGAPTAGADWAGIGAVAGVVAIVTVVLAGVLAGVQGERWHQRLMDRALDPAVGPEADLVRQQRRLERAEERLARKREEAERRGVLVASRHNSGEIPVVKWDEAAAAPTEASPQPGESQSAPI